MLCCALLCFQVIRLRKKLSGAADAVKGLFGVGGSQDEVVAKLERMQVTRAQGNMCCLQSSRLCSLSSLLSSLRRRRHVKCLNAGIVQEGIMPHFLVELPSASAVPAVPLHRAHWWSTQSADAITIDSNMPVCRCVTYTYAHVHARMRALGRITYIDLVVCLPCLAASSGAHSRCEVSVS